MYKKLGATEKSIITASVMSSTAIKWAKPYTNNYKHIAIKDKLI